MFFFSCVFGGGMGMVVALVFVFQGRIARTEKECLGEMLLLF